jgi:hypothetical protein
MNERKRWAYNSRNILSPDGNKRGKTRQLHESRLKHFTYTNEYCIDIQNISRIRQTNKEMPNKAKYTISGNEACKNFVTSTVLIERKFLNN